MLDVVFGQASDAGRVRAHNEDSAAAFIPKSRQEARRRGWMFAVADGFSGIDVGKVASARATKTIADGFAQSAESGSLASLVARLVQNANTAVHDDALQEDTRGRRMATTVVLCALRYDQAVIAHVGHSRCYHVRSGSAHLLTNDHTWVSEQRKLGLITEAEAEYSDKRHVLTRSLGAESSVTVDTNSVRVNAGDVLVLCTDGLYGAMYPEDIARITSQQKDPGTLARELVSYAVEVDGSDNATAQVIQVLSTEQADLYGARIFTIPSAS